MVRTLFGEQTEVRVKYFQHRIGITVNGVVGPSPEADSVSGNCRSYPATTGRVWRKYGPALLVLKFRMLTVGLDACGCGVTTVATGNRRRRIRP